MVIKNVLTQYAFISKPDDNGNFRINFKPQEEETKKVIEDALKSLADSKNCKDPDWWGSYNPETGYYGAKCSHTFKNRQGEEISNKLRVYNRNAQLLEEVPSVKNGAIMNIEVEPYYCEYKKKNGVMFGLRSVQLLDYEEYIGSNPYVDEDSEYEDEEA